MAKPTVTYVNPPSAPPAQGLYSHVARMKLGGDLAFIAGQLAIDKAGKIVGPGDVGKQLNAIFDNMGALLKDMGADYGQVVQFTTYLTSADLIPAFMAARAERFPKMFPSGKYPPNTLLVVSRLVKPEFLVEVEAIAAVPAG